MSGEDKFLRSQKIMPFVPDRFNLRNSAKFHPQNTGNRILESIHFKVFRGSMPPDPPSMAQAFGVRPPPQKKNNKQQIPWLRHCPRIVATARLIYVCFHQIR